MVDLGSVFVASGPMWVNSKDPKRAALHLFYTSLCTGELNAIRKQKCFILQFFLRRGVVLGYVGRNDNLKEGSEPHDVGGLTILRESSLNPSLGGTSLR